MSYLWPFSSEAGARRLERSLRRIQEQQRRLRELSKPTPWRDLGGWYS